MRWLLIGLLTVHGLIHFVGVTQALGMGPAQLSQPVGRGAGLLWLGAGIAMLVTAGLVLRSSPAWWVAGALALVLSQAVILTAWSDARFGTVANVLVLMAVVYGFASQGPWSLRAEYRREVLQRAAAPLVTDTVGEADLASLPDPVQRYLRFAGVVGQPRIHHFRVDLRGRIRGAEDQPWMDFTSTQTNFVGEPARFFLMDAKRSGLPLDVFHAFRGGEATMRVRLLSLLQVVSESGADLTRAETVTLFNDLCLFAPGALVDAPIRWESIDDHTAVGHYTIAGNTVTAELVFDREGRIVDFRSSDRLYAAPDGRMKALPWSTPLSDYRDFGATRLPALGEGRWAMPEGSFSYIDLEVTDVVSNGPLE